MLNTIIASPATGDNSWIVGVILAVAAVVMITVLVISKKMDD